MNKFVIRRAEVKDARNIIEAHHAAIREKAAEHYTPEIIDLWAPKVITDEKIEKVKAEIGNPDFYIIVAEAEGVIFGFGMVIPAKSALRAVYVRRNPYQGVGRAVLQQLVDHAKTAGATFLEMDASVNAEAFYRQAGFQVLSYGTHLLGASGVEMACVKMRTNL